MKLRFAFALLLAAQVSPREEPVVRIGIERSVAGFTLSSDAPYLLDGRPVRSARFTTIVALASAEGEVRPD